MTDGLRTLDPAGIDDTLDGLFDQVDELSGRGLDAALREAERLVRRADALRVAITARAELTARFREDGHRSVRAWYETITDAPRVEAAVAVRTAKALRVLSELGAAFAAGEIPIGSVHTITRRISRRVTADVLPDYDHVLAHWAKRLPADDVAKLMAEWDRRVDPDGNHESHQDAVEDRSLTTGQVGAEFHLKAQGGAMAGATITEILDRFTQAEYEADRAAAEAEHGEGNFAAKDLARTDAQRRFDALYRALLLADRHHPERTDAVPCPNCGSEVEVPVIQLRQPLVNTIIDFDSIRHWMDREYPASSDPTEDLFGIRRWACHSDRGVHLDPDDVIRAALSGYLRRVVTTPAAVITDVGARQRLFKGTTRDAALMQHHECVWPGCHAPAARCEADHLQPHNRNGPTVPTNGAPLCDYHNRYKHDHGYDIERNPDGTFHTYRPDGTELT